MKEILSHLTNYIEVVVIIAATFIVAKVYKHVYKRVARKSKAPLFLSFINSIVLGIIYVVGILCAIAAIPQLSSLANTLLAGSGILALAVSLSAQESLGNIVSGLFITLFHPFEVGDRVTLVSSNITGYVESITLRHTIIRTLTNTYVTVPNSTMNKEIVENTELIDPTASYFMDVSIAYESDVDKATEIVAEVIRNHPLCLQDKPVVVQLRAFEASGLALRAKVWTRTIDDNFTACSDIRKEILKRFKESGIEIPYNKVVIHDVRDQS